MDIIIGQKLNKQKIDNFISTSKFPKFIIVQGLKGSGKKTLFKYAAEQLNVQTVYYGNKVADIRQLINDAYSRTTPILYYVDNSELMSTGAANAILKLAEEPPKYAFIVLASTNNTLLNTLKSRAVSISIQPYSQKDKLEYLKLNNIPQEFEQYLDICDTLFDINVLHSTDYRRLFELCNNIVENITKANYTSVFKIINNIKLKEDKEGFDAQLFTNCLINLYRDSAVSNTNVNFSKHLKSLEIVEDAKQKITTTSYNKQFVLENMLVHLKEV